MWTSLFSTPRARACSKTNLLVKIKRELIDEGVINGDVSGKGKFSWVRHWGYGASAYFFDYLDPILRKPIVEEFKKIVKDVLAFPQTNSTVPDPFDYKKLVAKSKGSLSKTQQKRVRLFTKNFNEKVYKVSANLPQITAALDKWKWPVNLDDPSYFRTFIITYDMNYDGRLNPREFVLASIYGNQQTVGSSLCQNCYSKISKTLDAMFLYLDCNMDGLLSAEELWSNLPLINRKTSKWNMFAFGNDESIRTASVNDFILKNNKSKDGFVTRAEFRVGILLGYWDRQAEKQKILDDGSRSLKRLRWKEGDMIDVAQYNYHKKKMIATHRSTKKK